MKLLNLRGDLFATAFSFASQASIKLVSSVLLTRILKPEAYGIITILMSVVFILEMLADLGINMFIIRDEHGEEQDYINTGWTLRLGRAVMNFLLLFFCAPMIAVSLYNVSSLTVPLRVMSLLFLIGGFESMSFPIAIRNKRSRISMYTELASQIISTCFSVTYCYITGTLWGVIYGILLNRLIVTVVSYQFYKDLRPRLDVKWPVAKRMFGFTKFTLPSSLITLALSQFDKAVFLRLFDLSLLGVYGLAGNIAGPIESLIVKISQVVLFPRCAENYRRDPDTYARNYYTDNTKLFASILFLPAAVGGAAHFLIATLYDPRYAAAAFVLQAFAVRAAILSLTIPGEDLLFAAGETHLFLMNEILRATSIFIGSLLGYHFLGFPGFTYGIALSGLPSLFYFLRSQKMRGFLNIRYEVYKVVFLIGVAAASFVVSKLLSLIWLEIRSS